MVKIEKNKIYYFEICKRSELITLTNMHINDKNMIYLDYIEKNSRTLINLVDHIDYNEKVRYIAGKVEEINRGLHFHSISLYDDENLRFFHD